MESGLLCYNDTLKADCCMTCNNFEVKKDAGKSWESIVVILNDMSMYKSDLWIRITSVMFKFDAYTEIVIVKVV